MVITVSMNREGMWMQMVGKSYKSDHKYVNFEF